MQFQNQYPYQNPYQTQVPAPMDRLAQLQAQQYQTNMQSQQLPQTNQGILWVQGESAARSYLVAPNSTVLLMDSESPVFYLKSADGSGMPLPLRIFDYKERTQNAPQATQTAQDNLDDKYVTRKEYDDLQAKYEDIMNRLNSFHDANVSSEDAKRPSKPRSKGGSADE